MLSASSVAAARRQLLRPGLRTFQTSRVSQSRAQVTRLGRRFQSNSANASSGSSSQAKEPPKKGIRALMSKYGYSALGVYLALTAIDLPLCFLLVHSVGTEKMEEWEHKARDMLGFSSSEASELAPATIADSFTESSEKGEVLLSATQVIQEGIGRLDLGSEASSSSKSNDSNKWFGIDRKLLAEFGIAYALHKSLIFIRLPITAAITPSVVKIAQRWGFGIGKGVTSSSVNASSAAAAADRVKKFGTPANSKQRWGSWFF